MSARSGAAPPIVRVQAAAERIDTRRLARLLARIVEEHQARNAACGESGDECRKQGRGGE